MARGQINNEDNILIEPHLEKWAMIAQKFLPEMETNGQLKNREGVKVNIKLLICEVIEPLTTSTYLSFPTPETVITNDCDAERAVNIMKAQIFAFNNLFMQHCWILFGFILNKDSRVPVVITYFSNIEKAVYRIQKKFHKINVPQNPQVN